LLEYRGPSEGFLESWARLEPGKPGVGAERVACWGTGGALSFAGGEKAGLVELRRPSPEWLLLQEWGGASIFEPLSICIGEGWFIRELVKVRGAELCPLF